MLCSLEPLPGPKPTSFLSMCLCGSVSTRRMYAVPEIQQRPCRYMQKHETNSDGLLVSYQHRSLLASLYSARHQSGALPPPRPADVPQDVAAEVPIVQCEGLALRKGSACKYCPYAHRKRQVCYNDPTYPKYNVELAKHLNAGYAIKRKQEGLSRKVYAMAPPPPSSRPRTRVRKFQLTTPYQMGMHSRTTAMTIPLILVTSLTFQTETRMPMLEIFSRRTLARKSQQLSLPELKVGLLPND